LGSDECYELELDEGERSSFGLDSASVLLELRSESELYGVFYTAKGLQWDIWSDIAASQRAQDLSFARDNPMQAVRELLGYCWRPDFEYSPDEE
jgi:2-hydroxy-3-keto-5-methylthiopentenyl-1-phosphate phosphatase